MKTLLSLVFGFFLLAGIAAILSPHRAVAQASEYAALFAQCRQSGGYPGATVEDWNNGFCKNCPDGGSGGATCRQSSSTDTNGGTSSTGSSDLATESANAMAKGMMNGNSQEFAIGVGGMILNGLLENSGDGGAAAAEEARQEAIEKQREAARRRQAEEEQARRLALSKARILNLLKDDTDSTADPFKTVADPGAVAIVPEGALTVGGLQLKSDDDVQQASLPKPNSDPMAVDARNVPSGLPQGMDDAIAAVCAGAPAGVCERMRKGFQAVMTKDWNVAKAWLQDALSRDPGNAALKAMLADIGDPPAPASAVAAAPARDDAPMTLAERDAFTSKIMNDEAVRHQQMRNAIAGGKPYTGPISEADSVWVANETLNQDLRRRDPNAPLRPANAPITKADDDRINEINLGKSMSKEMDHDAATSTIMNDEAVRHQQMRNAIAGGRPYRGPISEADSVWIANETLNQDLRRRDPNAPLRPANAPITKADDDRLNEISLGKSMAPFAATPTPPGDASDELARKVFDLNYDPSAAKQ